VISCSALVPRGEAVGPGESVAGAAGVDVADGDVADGDGIGVDVVDGDGTGDDGPAGFTEPTGLTGDAGTGADTPGDPGVGPGVCVVDDGVDAPQPAMTNAPMSVSVAMRGIPRADPAGTALHPQYASEWVRHPGRSGSPQRQGAVVTGAQLLVRASLRRG